MSTSLQTFDDRTIKRAREKFTDGKRGSGDDPIATHSKVAQDVLLGHLERLISRAENKAYETTSGLQGEIDGQSLIDPYISYGENVAKIQEEYGVEFGTYARKKQKAREKDADEKARRHARDWLTEKVEDIADDNPADLLSGVLEGDRQNADLEGAIDEIRDEFDETLIADVLAYFEQPDEEITAPDPTPTETSDEPVATVETTDERPTLPDPEDRPNLVKDDVDETPAEPVATAEPTTVETRDYSGIAGFARLLIDSITANYEAGKREALKSDDPTQTTLEAY